MSIVLPIIEAFKYNLKPLKERLCIATKEHPDGTLLYAVGYRRKKFSGEFDYSFCHITRKSWGDVELSKTSDQDYVCWMYDRNFVKRDIRDYLKTQKKYEEYKEPEITFEDFKNE